MGVFGYRTCRNSGKASGYSARFVHSEVLRRKEIETGIASICGYNEIVVGAVLDSMEKFICQSIQSGCKLDFGTFGVGLSVRANFPAANSPFDPSKHKLAVDIRPGVAMRKAIAKVVPSNITDVAEPRIVGVISAKHQDTSNYFKILCGDECEMVGCNLPVNVTGPDEGVWLESRQGDRVATGRITRGDDTLIYFVFDGPIEIGEYWLVVGCRLAGANVVATARRLVNVVSQLA